MGDRTGIEWTEATWNPVTGCTKVSPGCDHCYAETLAERFRGTPGHYYEQGFDVQLRPAKLDQPLRWTRPRMIFVNSMSDLFHDEIPNDYIAQVFAVMGAAGWHTFQLLTKRHARMRSLLSSANFRQLVEGAARGYGDVHFAWPLPNLWLGVSTEDQQWADIRIPALLQTPAAVRWISAEPLLGPIDLSAGNGRGRAVPVGLDWVVVGGESGPKSRPMHPDWARALRDQCADADVPFLFKQWGDWAPSGAWGHGPVRKASFYVPPTSHPRPDGVHPEASMEIVRVGKKAAGRELDGKTYDGYPAVVDTEEAGA